PTAWFETRHRSEEIIEFFPTPSFVARRPDASAPQSAPPSAGAGAGQEEEDGIEHDFVCLCIHGKVSHLKKSDLVRSTAVALLGRFMRIAGVCLLFYILFAGLSYLIGIVWITLDFNWLCWRSDRPEDEKDRFYDRVRR